MSIFLGKIYAKEVLKSRQVSYIPPIYLPQSKIYISFPEEHITIKTSNGFRSVIKMNPDRWWKNTFGYELEVNYTRFMNIGFGFNFSLLNGIRIGLGPLVKFFFIQEINHDFSIVPFVQLRILGGPLGGYVINNFFVPEIYGMLGVQPSVTAGLDFYSSRWLAASFQAQLYTAHYYQFVQHNKNNPRSSLNGIGYAFEVGLKTTY